MKVSLSHYVALFDLSCLLTPEQKTYENMYVKITLVNFALFLTPQNLLLCALPEEKPAFVKIYSFIWMVNV